MAGLEVDEEDVQELLKSHGESLSEQRRTL